MANWHLLRNEETHGPYPEEQLREWIRSGNVVASDKVAREGDSTWVSVDMVPEFAAELAAAPAQAAAASSTAAPAGAATGAKKDKLVAGILAILLGGLGVHHFYLGSMGRGILYIVLACVGISPILGIIDGILYLTKPDDQFQRNYMNWFCSGD